MYFGYKLKELFDTRVRDDEMVWWQNTADGKSTMMIIRALLLTMMTPVLKTAQWFNRLWKVNFRVIRLPHYYGTTIIRLANPHLIWGEEDDKNVVCATSC